MLISNDHHAHLKHNAFYTLGVMIYTYRWGIVSLWLILIAACIPILPHLMQPFKTTGFVDERSQSIKTETHVNQKLGFHGNNRFIILYQNNNHLITDPVSLNKIKKSLSLLKNYPIAHDILYPSSSNIQISKDKHTAYAVIIIKQVTPINNALLDKLTTAIKTPKGMTIQVGGEPLFQAHLNQQTQDDLYRADYIATPFALITMLFVFGSVIAACLPIILGGGCALLILSLLYGIAHVYTLSIFTINIALLLGLCLCLDYSLFIINRFRDELHERDDVQVALAITVATAGKAVFFSGLAVFVSLSALLMFPINILCSVAIGGLTAVFIAVSAAIILLPAILGLLKKNINRISIRIRRSPHKKSWHLWEWLARKIVHRPLVFFFPIMILLLLLGYPFLSAHFGVSDYRIFPQHSEHRLFFDTYAKEFKKNELTPISMVIESPHHNILSQQNISTLYDLGHRLQDNPLIESVQSIVTVNHSLKKKDYKMMYHIKLSDMDSKTQTQLTTTTTPHLTVMQIIEKPNIHSPQTQILINELKKTHVGHGLHMSLMGTPVNNVDVIQRIYERLPAAILWILGSTYLILLLLLRSVFLPLKAIVMNLLSLCACYGALVLVFQEGYLHHLLHFEPQGMLDISLLVIIFCAIFGFSMDYEVFLLSRIKETYEITHDNEGSIVFGIQKSSRIITSAALIVIVLCGSFFVADVLMVKAFGLGIAVAIFVDAFLIRTLLVPSTMALLKSWNWYLPQWLDKCLPKW